LSGDVTELLDDIRERVRMFASLTTVGIPRALPAAAAPAAALPAARAAAFAPIAGDPGGLLDLPGVRGWVGDCQRCKLAGTRTNIVFGQGNPNADLMFVGEAPGADEDEQGLAFVGRAGQLLTDIIEKGLKMPRADVFIANVLKCVRYSTLVRLENGSWERIGRLVAQRYAGRVMTVDGNGALTTRPVVGWHRTPLAGRRVFRISHRASRARGGNRHGSYVTEDHPVLTRRGWVQARCLRPTDQIAIGHGLSVVAHDVIIGSILGDGTLNRSSSYIALVHSRKQSEYLKLKAEALKELKPVVYEGSSLARKDGKRHETIACRTRASRAIAVLRDRFYPDGVKQIPSDLEISPRALAIWFLDDGYMRVACAKRERGDGGNCVPLLSGRSNRPPAGDLAAYLPNCRLHPGFVSGAHSFRFRSISEAQRDRGSFLPAVDALQAASPCRGALPFRSSPFFARGVPGHV
jgi:hypothetical protein